MIPGVIPGATRHLGAPVDWSPEVHGTCGVLPILDTTAEGGLPVMISEWQPTQAEIDQIVAGKPVRLQICGNSHPPVSVYVL